MEGCGGGRKGATDQRSHLKHLSVAHLKKIWTGFSKPSGKKTLLGVGSFRGAWLQLVIGV